MNLQVLLRVPQTLLQLIGLKPIPLLNHGFFFTLSKTLEGRLVTANPKIAKQAWDDIEIFLDNKRTRTIALKCELRVIQLGD